MARFGLPARFLRWVNDFVWPGDYDRESAKMAYKVYLHSKDVASLNASIESFELAVTNYRKHKNPSLSPTLINYATVVWKHYEDCGRSPEDLDKVIRLDTEALKSWSGDRNTQTYLLLLNALAKAHFEQYQKAFELGPIKPEEKEQAFDKAVNYYTELKGNPASGNQRSTAQIQLGIIFRTRCKLEQTLNGIDIGVHHFQDALSEATRAGKEVDAGDNGNEAQQRKEAAADVEATCLLHLATSYEVRYELANDPRRIHDLNIAIDYNTRAKTVLQDLRRPELLTCTYDLARRRWLRWRQTDNKDDYDAVRQLAKAIKRDQNLDNELEMSIDHILLLLGPTEFDDGQLGNV